MSWLWIGAWIASYILGIKMNCVEMLANRGMNVIENQYYRFFTGLLLHVNLFHLMVNVIAMYWVGTFLNGQISEWKLLIFSIVSGSAGNIIFSICYPDSTSIGGSPVIFAMIGLICALQLLRADMTRFQFGTAYGEWIVGYAILGNIPIFSKNISTLVIHMISFGAAFLFGAICVKIHIF